MEDRATGNDELAERLRGHLSMLAAQEVGVEDDVFELGLINSLRALEIVLHLEQAYGIEITVEDLDLANFRSAARLARFVEGKQAAGAC
ncbi:acyl carrier protein [Nocardia sp. NPDC052566]|uniref:acyl carrier protein n=1 Tax=Nocardia sp. NPDC052566 TaxID=3364330 RepID=UPI0037C71926